MADNEVFDLTHIEGQLLMSKCGIRLPAQMGTENFDLEQRANADDVQAVLRGCMREVSPLVREEHRPLFGSKDAWEQSADSRSWSLKKDWEQQTVPMKLNEDGLYGACWTLFIALHPECPKHSTMPGMPPVSLGLSVQEASEVAWPLAKKLGWEGQLRKMLKVEKRRGQTFHRDTVQKEKD